MKIEAFIIHLERAKSRAPQAEAFAAKLPMAARLLAAVDSEQLSDGEVAAVYRRNLHRPRYPFELRRQEIACFLSHRNAWREIVDRGLDAGLVAEDDVDADPVLLGEVIEAVLANMQPADFVRLPVKVREEGPLRFAAGKIEVIEPRLRGLGMQAQIVGREAARRLLAETEQFDRPVDTTIQLPGLTSARVLAVRPAFVAHVDKSVGGSVVQKKKKPIGEVLAREVKRAVYRLSIRLAARG
jgi:GR25 family glycosyltransferase involved in LPS biosynthesis